MKVFENAVGTDYLWKNVRVLGGAYGCMCGFNGDGSSYFVSYRDPNLEKTLDTYKGVIEYLTNFQATEEEMVKYIIGAVGTYDFPKSPSNKGFRSLVSYLNKKTVEDYKLEKSQIIDATEQDIKNIVKYIEAIVEQNNVCVIGNDKKIEEGNNYDLILMDDMMPKMSGVETFKKLQKIDNFNIPVIALTANAIAGMKENYLKIGFNGYISKPIDKKELERVLKTYLNAKK